MLLWFPSKVRMRATLGIGHKSSGGTVDRRRPVAVPRPVRSLHQGQWAVPAVAAVMLCLVVTVVRMHSWQRPAMGVEFDEVGALLGFHQVGFVTPPRWRRGQELSRDEMEKGAVGDCIEWRATRSCDADSPERPYAAQRCDALIANASGYCLCVGGRRLNIGSCIPGTRRRAIVPPFTCAQLCTSR